jgi:hypothetical protein
MRQQKRELVRKIEKDKEKEFNKEKLKMTEQA